MKVIFATSNLNKLKEVREIIEVCKEEGINTCLDTSGCILNDDVKKVLSISDHVMLDLKYNNEELYQKHVGCSYQDVIKFLEYLNEMKIDTRVRQVIIPSINDSQDSVIELVKIVAKYDCVNFIELLPFKNICQVKYDEMNIKFPLEKTPNMDVEVTANMQVIANELLKMYRESR